MPNWCENLVLIRGQAEDIKRYKDSLLKDATGEYYACLCTVPLPELKDEAEVEAFIAKESDNRNVFSFHNRAFCLEVTENNPEELLLRILTANSRAWNLCTDELFPKLSILHKYRDPISAYQGFSHYVKGELIASGYEDRVAEDPQWQMDDYNPWPPVCVKPLE